MLDFILSLHLKKLKAFHSILIIFDFTVNPAVAISEISSFFIDAIIPYYLSLNYS
jgi:hypothetical protein